MLNAKNLAKNCTLGLLAGGQARRLNGANKALLKYQDEYLFIRILNYLNSTFAEQLISAQAEHDVFVQHGLRVVFDNPQHTAFSGPLAGIEALMHACKTEWLITLPVDIKYLPSDLMGAFFCNIKAPGSVLVDVTGVQPLCTLWHVASCKPAIVNALDESRLSVRDIIAELELSPLKIANFSLGNLNTAEDFET